MVKSGKAIYSKLNYIYIYIYHVFENVLSKFSVLCCWCTYLVVIHAKSLANILFTLYIFSILFFVFIQIECVRCCAILTTGIRAKRKSPWSVKMENSKIGIEKFDESDFGFWKMQIEDYLYQKDLHELLLGVKPDTMTTKKWKLKDRQALGLVRLTLSKNVAFNIIKEKTTSDLLKTLSNMYEKPSAMNKV